MLSEYNQALLTIPFGVFVTLKYTIISLFFGTIVGVIITVGQISKFKPISLLAQFYVSLLRGTPVLLQLSIVYFALPVVIKFDLSIMQAGILCFSLNSGAYITEIIRGGLLSIDKGQFEAAESLNINGFKKYRYIIAPQVLRNITPAMVNELISLIKETAIISIIGETDIMRNAQLVTAQYYTFFTPLIVAGITYYTLIMLITCVGKYYENKMNIYV